MVVGEPGLLGVTPLPGRLDKDRDHVGGHAGPLLHARLRGDPDADDADRVMVMLGALAEGENEPLPRLHGHRFRRAYDERRRRGAPRRPATFKLLLLIGGSEHRGRREALLRPARERHRQRHVAPPCRHQRHVRLRGRGENRLPDRLVVRVEEDHPRPGEARADAAVGSVPDDDPIEGLLGAKIDLPPRIGLRGGVGDGIGDEETPFGNAVDGAAGGGVEGRRDLRRRLATGDVLAAAENLDLGQRKDLFIAGELDADESPPRRRRCVSRLEPGRDAGDDEIAGVPRRSPWQGGVARKGQLHRGEHPLHRKLDPRHPPRPDGREVDRPVGVDSGGNGPRFCRWERRSRGRRRPECRPGDGARKGGIPGHAGGGDLGCFGGEDVLGVGDLSPDPCPLRFLVGREELKHWRVVAAVGIGGVVEDRVDPEEIFLRDRVVFVAVALGAGDRRPHPRAEGRVHPVDDGHVAELLVDRSPLGVGHRVAMEGRRHPVVGAGVGHQVARQLERREPVERHVGVEGPDDPVTKSPD